MNLGTGHAHILSPVLVASRICGTGEIVAVEEIEGAIRSTVRVTVENQVSDKPALVIDTISRYFPE